MEPVSAAEIRGGFVNSTKSLVKAMTLPRDFDELPWESLDYLGWRDPKAPARAYLVVPRDGAVTAHRSRYCGDRQAAARYRVVRPLPHGAPGHRRRVVRGATSRVGRARGQHRRHLHLRGSRLLAVRPRPARPRSTPRRNRRRRGPRRSARSETRQFRQPGPRITASDGYAWRRVWGKPPNRE